MTFNQTPIDLLVSNPRPISLDLINLSRVFALAILSVLGLGCGDLSDTEITSGRYSVYYHESENTEPQARELLAYMDSMKAPFETVRISTANDTSFKGLSLFVEGEFKNAKNNDEQRLFAAHLARRLSYEVFDSVFCSVTLVSSVDAVGIEGLRGSSNDPRLD